MSIFSSLSCVLRTVQVAGIIAGQLSLGFLADRIGRKWGSVITAALMLVGGILILASAGSNPRSLFLMYTTCQVSNHSCHMPLTNLACIASRCCALY